MNTRPPKIHMVSDVQDIYRMIRTNGRARVHRPHTHFNLHVTIHKHTFTSRLSGAALSNSVSSVFLLEKSMMEYYGHNGEEKKSDILSIKWCYFEIVLCTDRIKPITSVEWWLKQVKLLELSCNILVLKSYKVVIISQKLNYIEKIDSITAIKLRFGWKESKYYKRVEIFGRSENILRTNLHSKKFFFFLSKSVLKLPYFARVVILFTEMGTTMLNKCKV